MSVLIQIEYYADYIRQTNRKTEELLVSSTLSEAYQQILKHISEKHGIHPPFIMMMDNRHIAGVLKHHGAEPLKERTVFKILPFISGG